MEMTYLGRYSLTFDAVKFAIKCPENKSRFSGLATSRLPKLYVVSVEGKPHPVYVGITKQPMSNRLRIGWAADGKNGYYGYLWRRHFSAATMDIWCQLDSADGDSLDIETVEAELVYLIRQAGQWPAYQTEIHFHRSTEVHRQMAATIGASFGLDLGLEETGQ
ncbi:hypothetical protein [Pseudomonas fluorescens]|uniref:Uncharacterized protein n=1 Tax=Pseudomonas fluorescens TaxID=294 RepID=A0AAE2A7X4_PSEFL|nr:hypothetical protein [Pseudomonas fluorescens]KIF60331.1 hypothetical protein QS95_12565 [Pseudomonas fluorescens]